MFDNMITPPKSFEDALAKMADNAKALDATAELICAASHFVSLSRKGLTPYIPENGRHGKTSAWAELIDAVDDYNRTNKPST